MVIFFQELILLVFLWVLRVIDGFMGLFSVLTGVKSIQYRGQELNIVEMLFGDSIVGRIFWCMFILAIGLSCVFAIVSLAKNMISARHSISSILGKFFLAVLGMLVMLLIVILGISIVGTLLQVLSNIFEIDMTVNLSETIFNACVGDWLSGYSIAEVDIQTITVRQLFGEYDQSQVFGDFPMAWKYNGMINPDTFLYFPALIVAGVVGGSLVLATVRLSKRIYELAFMYVTMPLFMSTLPLDDGARFRSWSETFISKIIIAYGTVIAVNLFALILPIASRMQIDGFSNATNQLFQIVMMLGGTMVIPAGQALFSKLFASDNAFVGGKAGLAMIQSLRVENHKNSYRRYARPATGDLPYYESRRYVGDELEREHEGLGG